MKFTTLEERRTAAVIRKITATLEFYNYQNVKYQSSDCHAHYFQYESVEDNGEIEIWDLQVELEGEHEINHKPTNIEDWYFVGETFHELMDCSGDFFDIAV